MRLDAAEALELVRGHARCAVAEADLSGGTRQEGGSVAVEGCSARGGTSERDTTSDSGLLSLETKTALAEVLDDGGLHGKLDQVKREEPNNVLVKEKSRSGSDAGMCANDKILTQTQTIPIQPPEME